MNQLPEDMKTEASLTAQTDGPQMVKWADGHSKILFTDSAILWIMLPNMILKTF